MTSRAWIRDEIEKSIWFSYQYFWRYLAIGLIPMLLLVMKVAAFEVTVYLLFSHLMVGVLLLPGAVLLNFGGLRLLPSRTWKGDRRRPWVAGILAVPLTWLAWIFLGDHIHPGRFWRDTCGDLGAYLIHLSGIVIVCSSLALAAAWALPPRKRAALRSIPVRRLMNRDVQSRTASRDYPC